MPKDVLTEALLRYLYFPFLNYEVTADKNGDHGESAEAETHPGSHFRILTLGNLFRDRISAFIESHPYEDALRQGARRYSRFQFPVESGSGTALA